MAKLLNELSRNAKGGTELIQDRLYGTLDAELLDKFQIWFSRYRPEDVNNKKIQIFYAHDLANDPEADKALGNGKWANFHRIVFVSNWQAQQYWAKFNIPPSRTTVLLNSIVPLEPAEKDNTTIKLGYWSTPHRGLEILVPVFERLAHEFENITLDVFSSFNLYGWGERDEPYQQLFARCKAHPKINYHGAKSNEEVREFLKTAHVLAYPSIWPETSCLTLMEAMSAGMLCVHPNLGALYETAACWTTMYDYHEDANLHAQKFYNIMRDVIQLPFDSPIVTNQLAGQKAFADSAYSWNARALQWQTMLTSMLA